MAALDSRASGKMGMRAVVYYTTTTIIAVIIGIIMVLIIHPGKGSRDEFKKQEKIEQVSPADAFLDLIRYGEVRLFFFIFLQFIISGVFFFFNFILFFIF